MADELAVWLYGSPVATLSETRGRLRLVYRAETLSEHALGTPLLSLSLPLQPEPHGDRMVRPFFDGLLPEGQARLAIAYDVGVPPDDTFGLLAALGRDCAGAMVLQPPSEPPPCPTTAAAGNALSDGEIELLVANLRTAPLGVSERVRISLGGVQEKLLLTRAKDGSWRQPVDGMASTHIVKPEIARFPFTVENEAFCLSVARQLGLSVAQARPMTIGRRKLLVVERYDRVVRADGSIERIHQEDLCQALGIPPQKKYEEYGGPTLRRIARLVSSSAAPGVLGDLLRAVALNVVIGNGDAHGKNVSLLHDRSGRLTLAPLYDLMCTLWYGDRRLAMSIGGVSETESVTAGTIVDEAARWGMTRSVALQTVDALLERAPAAIAVAAEETEGLPDEIVAAVRRQLDRVVGTLR